MATHRVLRRARRRPPPRRRGAEQRRVAGFADVETATDLDLISPYMAEVDPKATTVEMAPLVLPLPVVPPAGPARSTVRRRAPPRAAAGAWPAWLAVSVALAAGVLLLVLLPSTPH